MSLPPLWYNPLALSDPVGLLSNFFLTDNVDTSRIWAFAALYH